MRACLMTCFCSAVALTTTVAWADTLEVGPGKTFGAPCDAIAAAADGDVIEIDAAGDYAGDVCAVPKNNLTLRGVGGRALIDAAGQNSGGKAIWVISGNDAVVENIEFSGAAVPDQNGAGIRQEGQNLTVRNCYFHDNQNGILAGDKPQSELLIEYSEFANNGFSDGQTHNLYINHVGRLVFQFNYSHNALRGHLLKSRAAETYVLYNRLTEESGTESYEIDIPNGGRAYIIGNLIQQGPNAENGGIISYEGEGANANNPEHDLYVVNNTIVNERANGGTFINLNAVTVPAVIRNNIFVGPGTLTTQSNADLSGNYEGDPGFVDQAGYDYHLTAGSPAENAGVAPGAGAGYDLTPAFQYVHPAGSEGRTSVGTIDIGAYEIGGSTGGGGGSVGAAGSAGSGGSGGTAGTGGASGTGGTAGSAGSAGTAGSAGSGGSSATGGSAGTGGSTAGTGGSAGSGTAPSSEDDDGGCGCRVVAPTSSTSLPLGLGLLLGLALLRRRRS